MRYGHLGRRPPGARRRAGHRSSMRGTDDGRIPSSRGSSSLAVGRPCDPVMGGIETGARLAGENRGTRRVDSEHVAVLPQQNMSRHPRPNDRLRDGAWRARMAEGFKSAEHLLYIVVCGTLAVAGFILFSAVVY